MQDVLDTQIRAPHDEFTLTELSTIIGADHSTVWRAVTLLEQLDVVTIRSDGQQYVTVNPATVDLADPILSIRQPEFHAPVRAFVDDARERCETTTEIDALVGIVLFGSVARGEADRLSDLDLFVVVEGSKTHGRQALNKLAADLQQRTFDGQRYQYQVLVETIESATRVGDRLREIFDEGITLVESEPLHALWQEVYDASR